jgi:hypothetical protein
MAGSLMSVAKIWIAVLDASSPSASSSEIATEYASSPVEHPAIQIRIGEVGLRASMSLE